MGKKGLSSIPSQVQLPGGIILKGLPFRILSYNEDGSPLTFELLTTPVDDDTSCTLYASERWIRSPDVRRKS